MLSGWSALVAVVLAVTLGIVVVPTAASATVPVSPSAASGITVTSGGGSILAGGSGRVTVTASNPSGADLYNATAVVVLPVGVSYVAGSATPGGANGIGEPSVQTWIPDPDDPDPANPFTAQVLVWENISDLPVGSETEFSFELTADDARYPVGSTFQVGNGVYANADERVIPTVTIPASGPPEISDATEGGSTDATATVIALDLTKAETANPEGEVYRGPQNPATFVVTVRTADAAGTDGVVVVDDVPAQFQVTDCTGAFDCTIEYVEVGGEVFTRLTWDLGDVGAGQTIALTYEAFVGLQEITLPDGDPTGAPTRPTAGGYSVTNEATATGTYTGSVTGGGTTAIETTADTTVQILDVGVVKTNAGGTFVHGQTLAYSFTVRTSEYVESSSITVVDTIPDGMCPVVPAGVPVTGGTWPAECPAPGGGVVTGGTMESVDFDAATGRFTVVFSISDRDEDEDATVGYSVFMREFYQDGTRTAVGDTFTNTVELGGTTQPDPDTNDVDSGPAPGDNSSSSSIGTDDVTLSKTIWANDSRSKITGVTAGANSCADGVYSDPLIAPAFQLGDLICFRIEADFPEGVATRAVQVGDFVPVGSRIIQWAGGPGNTVAIAPVTETRWVISNPADADPGSPVQPGGRLVLDILMQVDSVPLVQPRITGNLAKMRYTSGDGTVVALRDDVDLRLAPAPPLSLVKQVNGADAVNPVREGQALTFTIDVAHNGTPAGLNDYPLDTVQVWDVLPAGFDCADISSASPAITPATDCTTQADGTVRVVWNLDLTADPLAAGETTRISYDLTVPSPLSIDSSHTNTAAVTRFTAVSTNGIDPVAGGSTFYPTNPVGAFPDEIKNAAQAADTATITLAGASLVKQVTATSVTESNNDALGQATIGETVTWQYTATVPARSSVFNGVLDDNLPTDGRLVFAGAGTPTFSSTASGISFEPGCTRDSTLFRLCTDPADANYGSLLFPAVWSNTADTAVTFTVTLPTRVADVAANVHAATITNVATLTSTSAATGTSPVVRASDDATVTVVVPSPALTKRVALTPTGPWTVTTQTVAGGTTVYYRLQATNAAGRPPLHDTVVIDCISAGVIVGTLPAGLTGPVAGDGTNGCAVGRQKLTWTLPSALVAGTAQTLVYSVTMPAASVSGTSYPNTAQLTGTTLAGAVTGERTITTAVQNATVAVREPSITKVADRLSPNNVYVAGETVTYTVTATIPADTTLFNAAITDQLPTVFPANAGTLVGTPTCASASGLCAGATTLTPSGRTFGVFLGDIIPSATARTVTLTFPIVIPATVTAAQDNNVTFNNAGVIRWDYTDRTAQTSAVGSWNDAVTSANSPIIVRRPAVTVDKSVSDPSVPKAQGDIFTYTVAVSATAGTNNVTAYNVQVVDVVPAGVIPVVSATDDTPLADGGTVAGGGVWNAAARTITWTIASIAPGSAGTQSFSYPATLVPSADLTGSPLTNTVTPTSWASLASGGKVYGPGTADTAIVLPGFPEVDTTKTQLTPNPVYIGDEVSYSITLQNNGVAPATTLDAVDTLPSGWTYVAGSSSLGGAPLADPVVSGAQLTWADLGPLGVGAQHTITYLAVPGPTVAVGSGVAHTNSATASEVTDMTGGTSFDDGNGSYIGTSGSATARIHQADLQITKTAGTFTAGGTGTFGLVVRNNGEDAAVGVSVTDTLDLPAGVTFVSATGSGWTCTTPDADGAFTCARTASSDTLATGLAWPAITVTVAIAADVVSGTAVPNDAAVTSRTEDRTPGNNDSSATGVVITRADLAVVKTVTNPASGPVIAGEAIEWRIALTNNGPSLSRATALEPIVLSDDLPAGVSGVTLTGTVPDGCAIASGTLTCRITSDMLVGDTIIVTLAGTVDSDVPAGADAISNTATVTPITTDPVAGNNSSTVTVDTAVAESLTIVKEIFDPAPPAEVVPGETIAYRLTVANGGPSDARGVYVVDSLPDDVTFVEITDGTGWSAAVSGQTVTFTLAGDLATGATAPVLEYTTLLAPGFDGDSTELVNTASVSSAWAVDQDSDSATPGVVDPEADLALTKTVRPTSGVAGDPVIAGETVVYTLSTDNLGPSDAGAVTVVDVLPAAMTIVSVPAECTVSGQEITCVKTAGLDASETPWVLEVTARVAASFTGTTLVNAAVVTSVTSDPVPANNVDAAAVDVIQRAALTAVKTADAAVVRAGEDVTWTVVVGNDGPSDARDVTFEDVLDGTLLLVSADADGVACAGTTTITCDLGTIAAGDTTTVTIVATVRSDVPDGTVIDNTATAVSTTLDVVTGDPTTATDVADVEVEAVSELTIDKVTTTPTVSAGTTATFRIAVGNDGPSDAAASVEIVDTLPAGLTFVSASTIGGPATWSCAAAGQVVTCELQDVSGDGVTLAAGSAAPVLSLTASVSPSLAAGDVTNSATATSPSETTPPTDAVDVTVETFADLGITKTADTAPTAGEDYAWVIEVTNHGPSDSVATAADPIVVTDVLADGTTFVSATGAACTSAVAAGEETVTCEITDTIAVDDTVTITLTVAVAEDVSGSISNTAAVVPGATDEPVSPVWPNTATAVTPTVIEVADLAIVKTVVTDAPDIVAGEPITWELTVTNLGPSNSDATADDPITVSDTLPAGVTVTAVSGPSADWSCTVTADAGSFVCELSADLATADPQVITLTGLVDASTRGEIENTGVVAPGLTPQPTGTEDNDTSTVTADVTESADLVMLKDVSEDIVAGATGSYLLQVRNDGPSTARGVTVSDVLPAGLSFVGVVTAGGGASPWTCGTDPGDPQTVLCASAEDILPTQTVDLEIEVSAESGLVGDVENTARVTASTPDPDPTDNEDTAVGTLVTAADLTVVKSHDVDTLAVAGESFLWQITVDNLGPSDSVASVAEPIVVRDVLPEGVTLAAGGSAECAVDSLDPDDREIVVCLITETIVAGDAVSLDIAVDLDEALTGTLTNSAVVVPGGTADPDLGNNTGVDDVTVTEVADLAIVKTVATPDAEIVAGAEITWTLTVTNLGPSNSDATTDDPITVSDTLPAGVSFVSASGPAGWTCDEAAPGVVCALSAPLATGDAQEITVVGLIDADVQGDITNAARVSPGLTAQPGGATANDVDEVTSTVTEAADLALDKAVTTEIVAGGTGVYTLTVTNLGPSTARDIVITDTLPDGLSYASAGAGWTCTPGAAGVVVCAYEGTLRPADTLDLVFTVTAASDLEGDIVNTAVVTASTPDPVDENNTAEATGTIVETVDLSIVKTAVGAPRVGESFGYELVVANAGPSVARGVRVTDVVPAGLSVTAASGDGWTCVVDAGQVLCLLPELADGATATPISLTVTVLPAAYPEVANTATVTAATPEEPETLEDNTSTVTVAVPALSDLVITKELTGELVTGRTATYLVTVTNNGPTADPGPITVTDELPAELTAQAWSLSGADGTCTVAPRAFRCTVDGLAVGQVATFTFTVAVAASARGEIVNLASVASTADPVTATATAADTVRVVELPGTGGTLGWALPFALSALLLGALVLVAARARRRESDVAQL